MAGKVLGVREAWRACFSFLNEQRPVNAEWQSRRNELLADLLIKMATALGFNLSKTQLKDQVYIPQALPQGEIDALRIRSGLVSVLEGRSAIVVTPNLPEGLGDANPLAPLPVGPHS